jgi:parallel beta-helix repeat protein
MRRFRPVLATFIVLALVAPAADQQAQLSSVRVASGTQVLAGENIQDLVDSQPAGSTFVLHAGTYFGQSIIPKTGDVFVGRKGAVLDGENSAPFAFSKGNPPYPNDVTIRGLKITRYNPPMQHAAVDAGDASAANLTSGWIIEDNEVSYNNEYGIRVGNESQVIANDVHHNERLDITGQGKNILVASNEIAFGNYLDTNDPAFEAGGTKFVNTTGLVLRNNYVHDNLGGALWLDNDNINSLIEKNDVVGNAEDGIATEISYSAIIRDNIVTNNGWDDPLRRYTFVWNAGIGVHASANVDIYGNTVSGNYAGIVAVQQNRTESAPLFGPHLVQNLFVHNNIITQTDAPAGIYQTSVAAGIAEDTGDTSVLTSLNNRFVDNTYYLGNNPSPFCWGNYMTRSGWQQDGQDLAGTFH